MMRQGNKNRNTDVPEQETFHVSLQCNHLNVPFQRADLKVKDRTWQINLGYQYDFFC